MTTALVDRTRASLDAHDAAPAAAGLPALRRAAARPHRWRSARSVSARWSRCTIPTGPCPTRPPSRLAPRFALALPRVAAVRGGARRSRSTAASPRWSRLPRWPAGSASPASGSRTTASPIPRSPSRTGSSPRRSTPLAPSGSTPSAAPPPATSPTPSPPRRRAPGSPAWIFIPDDLELGKVVGTAVYNPRLVRVRGTYDDVNRLCTQAADRFGWGLVNINLRGYYGEGSKTVAFEICEQLGWRTPTAVVAPMAGGSLVTKLGKGFAEFAKAGLVAGPAPRLYGAQADGCAPIVRLVESGGEHVEPVMPAHHRALHRDRQPGRRPLRRAGDPRDRRLGRGRERRRHRGRHPAARRDHRHLHRDRGRGDGRRRRSRWRRRAGSAPRTKSSSASPATDSRPSRRSRASCPRPPSSHRRLKELEALHGRDL